MGKLRIMEKLYNSTVFDIIYLHGYHFITASFVFITNIVSEIIWNICNKDSCKIYNCYLFIASNTNINYVDGDADNYTT